MKKKEGKEGKEGRKEERRKKGRKDERKEEKKEDRQTTGACRTEWLAGHRSTFSASCFLCETNIHMCGGGLACLGVCGGQRSCVRAALSIMFHP